MHNPALIITIPDMDLIIFTSRMTKTPKNWNMSLAITQPTTLMNGPQTRSGRLVLLC